MENLFGNLLRSQMEKAEIKESELAEFLSYDTTYISKWINGSKLPSPRMAERILGQLARFFSEKGAGAEAELLALFQEAYAGDSRLQSFQAYNNKQMSFVGSRSELTKLTREALLLAADRNEQIVHMTATFDLFRIYGSEFKEMMRELHDGGIKKVRVKMAMDTSDLQNEEHLYTAGIMNIIGYMDYIELSIVKKKPEQPQILLINDLLCLQILWKCKGRLSAVFSTEKSVVDSFFKTAKSLMEGARRLLDPAEPEKLKETNVQLDSYSDHRQWLFYNEPPAMLFPDEIIERFVEEAEDGEYANYLMKLKNTFANRTSKSRIDLVLYASMINRYFTDGNVTVGNVTHRLTPEEVSAHFRNLSRVMNENPDFRIYLIRDTVMIEEELLQSPSLFIDTFSLYIENSKKGKNCNFHISTDPDMRKAFENYFEHMLQQSYCQKVTAEDLLRYL